jgi:uncharacterized protein (DUF305 family)
MLRVSAGSADRLKDLQRRESARLPVVPPPPVRVALAAALVFLAGSIGYLVGTRSAEPKAPSRADVGFLQDMIAHHEQAVELSSTALSDDLPAGVRSFALEVISDQRYEIGLMESTLRTWGEPVESDDGTAMGWMDHTVEVDRMPGMATEEQISELGKLRGDEAAALWIELMTAHHEGGIHMADNGVRLAKDPFVRGLATRIARNQRIEINEYAQLQERLSRSG